MTILNEIARGTNFNPAGTFAQARQGAQESQLNQLLQGLKIQEAQGAIQGQQATADAATQQEAAIGKLSQAALARLPPDDPDAAIIGSLVAAGPDTRKLGLELLKSKLQPGVTGTTNALAQLRGSKDPRAPIAIEQMESGDPTAVKAGLASAMQILKPQSTGGDLDKLMLQDVLARRRDVEQREFTAEESEKGREATAEREAAKVAVKQTEQAQKRERALSMYETGISDLKKSLEETVTGPFLGRAPAITSAQQTATKSVAAMAPILKAIFREAGEGTFTQSDQQTLLDMLPGRETLPEAREAALFNIDAIVRAKLADTAPMAAGVDVAPSTQLQLPPGWTVEQQ